MALKINKLNIFVSLLLISVSRSEWSWGKNDKSSIPSTVLKERALETSAPSDVVSESSARSFDHLQHSQILPSEGHNIFTQPEGPNVPELPLQQQTERDFLKADESISSHLPTQVLPLENHNFESSDVQQGSQVHEIIVDPSVEEGRSGRFLGISDKLCKLGVKGMILPSEGHNIFTQPEGPNVPELPLQQQTERDFLKADESISSHLPTQVLPLENHNFESSDVQQGSQVHEIIVDPSVEEGRSGRFLGISDKLCKLGVKGMCEKHKGYPPATGSHYGSSGSSSYHTYSPYTSPTQSSHTAHYPNANNLPPKPLKGIFSSLFNKKKSKGSLSQTYGAPQTYYPPINSYNPPQTTYKQPTKSYRPPKPVYNAPLPTYSAPKPKPHYVRPNKPKPFYNAPSNYKPSNVFHSPKPKDVIIHKVKGQHSVPTHHVSGIHPSKVEHVHTHTHIYKQTPPFDIRDTHPSSFPRDDGSSYQATSFSQTTAHKNAEDPLPLSNSFTSFDKSSFKPSQPLPFGGFNDNQNKRHILPDGVPPNDFNSFGVKQQQSFQSSIDKLSNSFGNGLYAVDCQCVARQYCAPENLVARSNPKEIGHLLDARNDPSDILASGNFSEDYYDYDYLHVEEDNNLLNETSRQAKSLEPTIIYSKNETNDTNTTDATPEDYITTEGPISATTDEIKRVRRSATEENSDSTSGLSGRQLTGFSPGIHGCGDGFVCCKRPVYIAAKTSQPVCGRGNPSIHGRVSSFQFEKGQSDFGEYPWQAAILRDEGPESMFVCGATLIDDRHVLTAAHCVNDLTVQSLKVRLGEWDVNRDTEFYKYTEIRVSALFVHPEFYKGNLYNDIAVLRLTNFVDIQGNPHISPICLPPPNTDFTNHRCHVTGWGKDAFGDKGKFQHILKELEIPVVNHQTCEYALQSTRLGKDYKLHEGFICAGGEAGKDACKGDGGGPLVCSTNDNIFQLAGIVSWGIGCGQEGIPGVYVNIPYYVDWIRSTTRL